MTRPDSHHAVIQAALADWWMTTDPASPPDFTAAAEQTEMYLLSSGYRIQPDTRQDQQMTLRELIAGIEMHLASSGYTITPAQHCGHLSPKTGLTTPRTECVLPPGHTGSHADDRGCRWWLDPDATQPPEPGADRQTAEQQRRAADFTTAEQRLRAALFTAHHWHQHALTRDWTITAHALACLLSALTGETDPGELGIDADQHNVFRATLNQTHTETIHAIPPRGHALTPCCRRSPFELPRTDRITSYPELVTCQPDTQPPEPSTDRRERYATAINPALPPGLFQEELHAAADAAMAIADREQQQLRRRTEQAEDLLRIANDTSNKSEAERERAVHRAEQAEAANARVRGLADRWATRTDQLRVASDHIRAALDQPAPESNT